MNRLELFDDLETNIFPPKHHHNKSYRIWMEVHLYVVKFVVIDRHIWSKLDARKKVIIP